MGSRLQRSEAKNGEHFRGLDLIYWPRPTLWKHVVLKPAFVMTLPRIAMFAAERNRSEIGDSKSACKKNCASIHNDAQHACRASNLL